MRGRGRFAFPRRDYPDQVPRVCSQPARRATLPETRFLRETWFLGKLPPADTPSDLLGLYAGRVFGQATAALAEVRHCIAPSKSR